MTEAKLYVFFTCDKTTLFIKQGGPFNSESSYCEQRGPNVSNKILQSFNTIKQE